MSMIQAAEKRYQGIKNARFVLSHEPDQVADYGVASGIFNVKLQTSTEEWKKYVLHTLEKIAGLSQKGFAFNVLTKYSDPDLMRSDLYYADPLALFDYCKKNFSRFVALLHNYPLYEFTILVRK